MTFQVFPKHKNGMQGAPCPDRQAGLTLPRKRCGCARLKQISPPSSILLDMSDMAGIPQHTGHVPHNFVIVAEVHRRSDCAKFRGTRDSCPLWLPLSCSSNQTHHCKTMRKPMARVVAERLFGCGLHWYHFFVGLETIRAVRTNWAPGTPHSNSCSDFIHKISQVILRSSVATLTFMILSLSLTFLASLRGTILSCANDMCMTRPRRRV